jgi:hypothetical protein
MWWRGPWDSRPPRAPKAKPRDADDCASRLAANFRQTTHENPKNAFRTSRNQKVSHKSAARGAFFTRQISPLAARTRNPRGGAQAGRKASIYRHDTRRRSSDGEVKHCGRSRGSFCKGMALNPLRYRPRLRRSLDHHDFCSARYSSPKRAQGYLSKRSAALRIRYQ